MAAYRCIGYMDTTAGGKQREVDAALQIKSSNRHKQRMGGLLKASHKNETNFRHIKTLVDSGLLGVCNVHVAMCPVAKNTHE